MDGDEKSQIKPGRLTALFASFLFNILPGSQSGGAIIETFSLSVVSRIIVSTVAFLFSLLFVSHFFFAVQEGDLWLIDAFCYFSIVGSMFSLITLYSSYPVTYALHLYIAVLAVGLAAVSLYSGGHTSPANICYIALPTLAIFGIGPAAGLGWFTVMLMAFLLECVAGYFGVLPASVVAVEDAHVAMSFAIFASYVFIFCVALHYKVLSTKLLGQFKKENKKYFYIANHDSLTGLASRRCFMDALDAAVLEAKDLKAKFCVLFFDLNEFKLANDRYGHDIGDQILIVFSKRLFANTRSYNLVGRIGGDEFAVLLEDLSDEETIQQRIDNYSQVLARALRVRGESILISASIGHAIYPVDGHDSRTLLQAADHKMYRDKRLFYSEKSASSFSRI